MPDIIFIVVVLPEPLCPNKQNISFENISQLKLLTAFKSSKLLEIFFNFKQSFCSNFCLFISLNS